MPPVKFSPVTTELILTEPPCVISADVGFTVIFVTTDCDEVPCPSEVILTVSNLVGSSE